MPVGPWPDFESCVRANRDKEDPEAYCGRIESQMGALPMWIIADVTYDSDAEAIEAMRLAREEKISTLSVRISDLTARMEVLEMGPDGIPIDWLETYEKGEIVAVTQLPVPAQGGARIVANPDGTFTAWMIEEGVQTSDRRIVEPEALTWRDPAPLTFSDREDGAHENAIHVGNLSNFRRSSALVAALIQPDPETFSDPMLPAVTKPRIENGRYAGHGAQWGTCHLKFGGCVTPPESPSGYSYARWKEIDGVTGIPIYKHPQDLHAPDHYSMEEARAWYDENCTLEGLGEVGDDTFGIWVSGSATPEVDDMYLSGDWRLVDGALELTAFLACRKPCFPLALVASDVQVSLVGAGVVTEDGEIDPTLEILSLLKREVVGLREEISPILIEREADRLLDSLAIVSS